MSWIKIISQQKATGALAKLYRRVSGPQNQIDNILRVHSLRPASLEGHIKLYKNVLHHFQNQLPKWHLEMLGCYVSLCNRCDYCVAHHLAGLRRLLNDEAKSNLILKALENRTWQADLEPREAALLDYTHKLTLHPGDMVQSDIESLRGVGLSDGEILEANQVIAYFAYANRTALGLGVNTDGEVLGLSPSESDPDQWHHQ